MELNQAGAVSCLFELAAMRVFRPGGSLQRGALRAMVGRPLIGPRLKSNKHPIGVLPDIFCFLRGMRS